MIWFLFNLIVTSSRLLCSACESHCHMFSNLKQNWPYVALIPQKPFCLTTLADYKRQVILHSWKFNWCAIIEFAVSMWSTCFCKIKCIFFFPYCEFEKCSICTRYSLKETCSSICLNKTWLDKSTCAVSQFIALRRMILFWNRVATILILCSH